VGLNIRAYFDFEKKNWEMYTWKKLGFKKLVATHHGSQMPKAEEKTGKVLL